MKTSQVKAYYERYMRAVSKYGYRDLSDCYKNPSQAKANCGLQFIRRVIMER